VDNLIVDNSRCHGARDRQRRSPTAPAASRCLRHPWQPLHAVPAG